MVHKRNKSCALRPTVHNLGHTKLPVERQTGSYFLIMVVTMVVVMELYLTLYHGCYELVLLLSSHEWVDNVALLDERCHIEFCPVLHCISVRVSLLCIVRRLLLSRHDSWVINISINVVHTSAYYHAMSGSCHVIDVISSCREGSGPVNRKTMVLMVLYFYIVYMEWMRELWLPSWLMLGRPVVGGIA